MLDVAIINEPSAAAVTLEPVRARLLHELAEPASASTLAGKLGLSRQKVNYYLRDLEKHGLVELVEERRKGNMTERVMCASAGAYVISPSTAGPLAPDPSRSPDRLSAQWLLALASRLVQDVGALMGAGAKARKRVATFAIDGEVRFAGAAERAAFAQDLSDAVAGLVAQYHDEGAAEGRSHRLVVALHPSMGQKEEARDGA
ncbi:Helix-turn-helix domain-containing protein [Amycolatopsis marina]|uniref:Helix-turn-helix domain-containing protein n=1 Tax=Amycolatopsis marina TaxID=490629 RepID=A0A1I0YQM4_9PSEU|nr:helix-turn-helix domain-containing protein [Amycolatopsis marina]SFB15689.1 Helix-turn-helix domain-containing protein [Amycolatopsis marina]